MSLPSGTHPLAGKTVKLNGTAADSTQGQVVPGALYRVEDWWHVVGEGSWQNAQGNWAAMHYGTRAAAKGLPKDDNVVYGKIGSFGHIVHVSELGEVVA